MKYLRKRQIYSNRTLVFINNLVEKKKKKREKINFIFFLINILLIKRFPNIIFLTTHTHTDVNKKVSSDREKQKYTKANSNLMNDWEWAQLTTYNDNEALLVL